MLNTFTRFNASNVLKLKDKVKCLSSLKLKKINMLSLAALSIQAANQYDQLKQPIPNKHSCPYISKTQKKQKL
jgi:hypothetical protein